MAGEPPGLSSLDLEGSNRLAGGTISSTGNNRVIDFDCLIIRTNDLGTPQWTLTPFTE